MVPFNRCALSALLLSLTCLTAAAITQQPGRPATAERRSNASADGADEADVVIYGATSGGVAAAIQVRRMGKTVIVLEPSKRVGGMTTGGLGSTDIGNKAAIGGISREFYQRVRKHYADPAAWKWQEQPDKLKAEPGTGGEHDDAMWRFEPSVALAIFNEWLAEEGVDLRREMRLDRESGVTKKEGRIVLIEMESGEQFRGEVFIDATYEGDLLAAAGVTYTVGREPNALYGETLSGVQTNQGKYHQFVPGVDPYVEPGNPESGLLPFIDVAGPGEEGSGDHRVQAYCFRMCMTDHQENRIPWTKPGGYEEQWYELLFRNFEAGAKVTPWYPVPMPNRKTDTNNNRGFSTDFIGQNYDYPEASYDERDAIVERHRLYQQGLMWTLANHPRVPESIRAEVSRWGLCKDEFDRGDGWQEQLYIREARRMIGHTVMTQHHCQGRDVAERSVGMAAYTMDSHHVQRHVSEDGTVRNEGDVQVGGFPPYPIDYGALVPKEVDCSNLLVPFCLSASHMAFGSIRMEPVLMILGQSAATAACLAIDAGVVIQDVDYKRLRERLLADGQILSWSVPAGTVPK